MINKGFDDWFRDDPITLAEREKLRELYKKYTNYLQEYSTQAPNRESIFIHGKPNEGYKFHLNVKPENVRVVAAYLNNAKLEHKYLSGGEIECGKIFTVYTGSKDNTEEVVRNISDNQIVSPLLEPFPVSSSPEERITPSGEAPYAPNIYGRFVGNKDRYRTKLGAGNEITSSK